MPEWWASRCRTWSKKPTPVFTSAHPWPSSSRHTLTRVSPVFRSAVPVLVIFSFPAFSFRRPAPSILAKDRGPNGPCTKGSIRTKFLLSVVGFYRSRQSLHDTLTGSGQSNQDRADNCFARSTCLLGHLNVKRHAAFKTQRGKYGQIRQLFGFLVQNTGTIENTNSLHPRLSVIRSFLHKDLKSTTHTGVLIAHVILLSFSLSNRILI